jgi:hypothetical protein
VPPTGAAVGWFGCALLGEIDSCISGRAAQGLVRVEQRGANLDRHEGGVQ